MKTITKEEAILGFDKLADLAHAGETVLVTFDGKPWMKLVPVRQTKPGNSAASFKQRLDRISTKPIPGASEILPQSRR